MVTDGVFAQVGMQEPLRLRKGCPIYLKRTHENTLKIVPIETLKKFAIDLS